MKIISLDINNTSFYEQIAFLLFENFTCWHHIDEAKKEVDVIAKDENVILIAVEDNHVIGLIGANPKYNGNVWELHPMAVKKELHRRGIGRQLIAALENEVFKRGGITIYLGTDDENNSTTLSTIDIYQNTFDRIRKIKNLKDHPFEFYQKCGYKIVGIVPDANGYGKPDIMMAKRVENLNDSFKK